MQQIFSDISVIVSKTKLAVRVELSNGKVLDWSPWLTTPSEGYCELASGGPYRQSEVTAVDIDPVRCEKIGRLVPDRKSDLSEELSECLTAAAVPYSNCRSYFRICIPDSKENEICDD